MNMNENGSTFSRRKNVNVVLIYEYVVMRSFSEILLTAQGLEVVTNVIFWLEMVDFVQGFPVFKDILNEG